MNREKYAEEENKTLDHLSLALDLSKLTEDLKRGTELVIPCPLCGGKITAVRSLYNGHLHAKCDTCKFLVME